MAGCEATGSTGAGPGTYSAPITLTTSAKEPAKCDPSSPARASPDGWAGCTWGSRPTPSPWHRPSARRPRPSLRPDAPRHPPDLALHPARRAGRLPRVGRDRRARRHLEEDRRLQEAERDPIRRDARGGRRAALRPRPVDAARRQDDGGRRRRPGRDDRPARVRAGPGETPSDPNTGEHLDPAGTINRRPTDHRSLRPRADSDHAC